MPLTGGAGEVFTSATRVPDDDDGTGGGAAGDTVDASEGDCAATCAGCEGRDEASGLPSAAWRLASSMMADAIASNSTFSAAPGAVAGGTRHADEDRRARADLPRAGSAPDGGPLVALGCLAVRSFRGSLVVVSCRGERRGNVSQATGGAPDGTSDGTSNDIRRGGGGGGICVISGNAGE